MYDYQLSIIVMVKFINKESEILLIKNNKIYLRMFKNLQDDYNELVITKKKKKYE